MSSFIVVVLSAMIISSLGGTILNKTIVKYPKVAAYQPVINGVAGNLVSVNASRISTKLHQEEKISSQQGSTNSRLHRISSSEYSDVQSSTLKHTKDKDTSRNIRLLLWSLVVPGHLVFNLFLHIFTSDYEQESSSLDGQSPETNDTEILFMFLYLAAALIQVGLLLYASGPLVLGLWTRGIDPDSASIPYLTSSGDFLGGILLSAAFHVNDMLLQKT